jgi:hypothetical protein
MQLGAWKSYVELEENLTLSELIELYSGILNSKMEDFKNMARANGATINEEQKGGDDQATSFADIISRVKERAGVAAEEDNSKSRSLAGGLVTIETI